MQLMPPMTSSMAEPGLLSARPRNTNFSIAAIMSENKEAEEDIEADQELEDSEEELEVGTEAGEDIAETSLETEEKVAPTVKKERKPKLMTGKTNCTDLDHIKCNLDNKDLWDKFCEFGTEMIITRTGRRMFPTVRCSFANLDLEPGTKYLILLDIVPCDNKRYRYAYHRSSWLVAGKADPAPPHRLYCHPDAPFTAEQLKKQVISFEKVKVTNNESDNTGQVILNSMHKFQPRIYLVKRSEGVNGPVTDIEKEKYRTFVFPETQFTAVTAYQNQLITKLKIESNPFAKGFRDSSSQDGDDPFPGVYQSHPGLPGGMPGMDPFSYIRPPFPGPAPTEDNNNLMAAAEKARMMMMYRAGVGAGSPLMPPTLPPHSLPLSPEILARYSLGLYNPALLAAMVRTSSTGSASPLTTSPPFFAAASLASLPTLSPKSPADSSAKSARFSPYVVPASRPSESPSRFSTLSDGEAGRSPSPRSSPPIPASRPPFPLLPNYR